MLVFRRIRNQLTFRSSKKRTSGPIKTIWKLTTKSPIRLNILSFSDCKLKKGMLMYSNQYVLNLYEWLCNPIFFYSFILFVKLQRKLRLFCWLTYCLKGWNSKCRKVFRGKWTSSRIIIFMSGASFRKVNKNKSFTSENVLRTKVKSHLLYLL